DQVLGEARDPLDAASCALAVPGHDVTGWRSVGAEQLRHPLIEREPQGGALGGEASGEGRFAGADRTDDEVPPAAVGTGETRIVAGRTLWSLLGGCQSSYARAVFGLQHRGGVTQGGRRVAIEAAGRRGDGEPRVAVGEVGVADVPVVAVLEVRQHRGPRCL